MCIQNVYAIITVAHITESIKLFGIKLHNCIAHLSLICWYSYYCEADRFDIVLLISA